MTPEKEKKLAYFYDINSKNKYIIPTIIESLVKPLEKETIEKKGLFYSLRKLNIFSLFLILSILGFNCLFYKNISLTQETFIFYIILFPFLSIMGIVFILSKNLEVLKYALNGRGVEKIIFAVNGEIKNKETIENHVKYIENKKSVAYWFFNWGLKYRLRAEIKKKELSYKKAEKSISNIEYLNLALKDEKFVKKIQPIYNNPNLPLYHYVEYGMISTPLIVSILSTYVKYLREELNKNSKEINLLINEKEKENEDKRLKFLESQKQKELFENSHCDKEKTKENIIKEDPYKVLSETINATLFNI